MKILGSIIKDSKQGGPGSWGINKWHTENIKYFPPKIDFFKDYKKLIEDEFLTKIDIKSKLTIKSPVLTIGSCFARELRFFLNEAGLNSSNFIIPSGLNNSFAIHDFIYWVVNGKTSNIAYGYDTNIDGKIVEWTPSEELESYRNYFKKCECFVFTLGLSEVWEEKKTKKVFWRGVPEKIFEKNQFNFRLTTVEENTNNIIEIIKLIKLINKQTKIFITLSPVPLKGTFFNHSCITSDCVSKSTLRVAINESLKKIQDNDNIFYFPSFEIVKWIGPYLSLPVYGAEDSSSRHVSRYIVINIINLFLRNFFDANSNKKFNEYLSNLGLKDISKSFTLKGSTKD